MILLFFDLYDIYSEPANIFHLVFDDTLICSVVRFLFPSPKGRDVAVWRGEDTPKR
jgi:hypothetical protein